ncbi:hypothetical protein DL93DRAFT_2087276 [Clavulina sp. PMI_390]|nr:hypothetical protein DL93DRAFT_2087276 [Clavulina sp. PMI_390]
MHCLFGQVGCALINPHQESSQPDPLGTSDQMPHSRSSNRQLAPCLLAPFRSWIRVLNVLPKTPPPPPYRTGSFAEKASKDEEGSSLFSDDRATLPEYTSPDQGYEGPTQELIAVLTELYNDKTITDKKIKNDVRRALTIASNRSVTRMSKNSLHFFNLISKIYSFFDGSTEHKSLTITLCGKTTSFCYASSTRKPLSKHSKLSRLLQNLADALHHQSRTAEACALNEEAVAILRESFRKSPGNERSNLASALHTYSLQLFYEERWTKALAASEEAVTHRRLLFDINPKEYMDALARSLSLLGAVRKQAKRFEDAKLVEEEGLVLWRLLFDKDISFYKYLMPALGNYIISTMHCGSVREYQGAVAEQEALRKKLREDRLEYMWAPNTTCAYRCGRQPRGESDAVPKCPRLPYEGPDAAVLVKLRELEADENATGTNMKEQAKKALDLVPHINITSEAVLPSLLCHQASKFRGVINTMARAFVAANQMDDGLLFGAETVRLERSLTSCVPPTLHMRLAGHLYSQATALHQVGRHTDACVLGKEAVSIGRACYEANPGPARPLLASLLMTHSFHLAYSDTKLAEEGRAAAEEAVELCRLAYALDPDQNTIRFANALQILGSHMYEAGRFTDATTIEDEGLKLRRMMYEKDHEEHREALIRSLSNHVHTLQNLEPPEKLSAAKSELAKLRVETLESTS